MGKTNRIPVTVYMTATEKKKLEDAAQKDNRSLSNFLLKTGEQKAEELGVGSRGGRSRSSAASVSRSARAS